MKVFICHNRSGDYLHGSGAWIDEPDEALVFERGSDAVTHCLRNGMREVHLRYSFPSPAFDFSIRLFEARVVA